VIDPEFRGWRVPGTAEGMAGSPERESGDLHALFDAVADSVPEARLRLRAWCDAIHVGDPVQGDLLLAVTEAAANAVQHAYPDGRPGTFSLDARREAGHLVITIRDEGVGMGHAAPSRGGGLGLEIIGRLFPDFALSEADPGTRVTIRTPPS
jgi:serine/threonine-protein kinase RsbW